MSRLVVNPGTPQAWEIQLRAGGNSLGRNESNDFQINDPSVSGSHCQIVVNNGTASLKDLGFTNGTFSGGARVQELNLEDGKSLKLGNVELIYYASAQPSDTTIPTPPPPVARIVARVAATPVAEHTPATAAAPPQTLLLEGVRHCKSHPRSVARYLCPQCDRGYCDLCVQTHERGGVTSRPCHKCGSELARVQYRSAPQKSFYAKLPGAFIYPFKGAGVFILFGATVGFSVANFIFSGIIGLGLRVCFYGYVFLFLQNIILSTTSSEPEPLDFPEMSDPASLLEAALQLVGTMVVSFWIPIGLAIAKFSGVDIPPAAIIGAVLLSGMYFPMAFLAVAMKDTVAAANPLLVVPAMLKAPLEYAVTVILLLIVFTVNRVGSLVSSGMGTVALHSHSAETFVEAIAIKAALAFLSMYLLTVTMRLLGLFYNGSKQKLGWFKF